ncbi:N-acetylmuramoyl-L-alanine amidase [Pseudomonas koreensis]
MPKPIDYYFQLPPEARPSYSPLQEELHPDFEWLNQNRARSRGKDVFEAIDTVVIHATAGYATSHAVENWHQKVASAHWIIPDEKEPQHGHFVWGTVAEAKAAYHVRDAITVAETALGDGPNVNNRSLGIEIVNTQDVQNYQDPFSTWQVTMTARIVLYAWAKYPNLKHVISHAKLDPTRRDDPGIQFPWDDFKNMVLTHSVLPPRNPLVFETVELDAKEGGSCCSP